MDNEYEKLKREVEEVTRERDRAAGALEQILKRIKREFGCKTLQEAEELLVKKQRQERKAAEEATAKKDEFMKKWKQKLEGL